jgi:hypothetical protein
MPLEITCDHCRKSFRISDDVAGKRFRCIACHKILRAPEGNESISEAPRAAASENVARPRPPVDSRRRSAAPQRLRNQSRTSPPAEIDAEDLDPFGLGIPPELSMDEMPGGRIGQPRQIAKRRSKDARELRATRPEAFAEYDKIVQEIAWFWIGLGVIVACLTMVLFYGFSNDARGDEIQRHRTILVSMMVISASAVVIGLITFSKSRIWVFLLSFICAAFLLGSLFISLAAGCLLWILPVSFCVMFSRLNKARAVYPDRSS